jgi:hypothetical protein
MTALRLGQIGESVSILRYALTVSPSNLNLTAMVYILLTDALGRLGQDAEALDVCLEGRARFPENSELLRVETLVRFRLANAQATRANTEHYP